MLQNDDRIFEMYYRTFGSRQAQEQARDRVHWIVSQAEGRRVLDGGCSQGLMALLLGRAGFEVLGIDIRADAIEFARGELAKEPVGVQRRVRFEVGDVQGVAMPDGGFDTIILGEILEHQSHPQFLLDAAARLLAPRGKVVITVPFGLHVDIDHKQTFYLSDLRALVGQQLAVAHLSISHKFICCVARPRGTDVPAITDGELLAASERAFLEIEKARDLELDSVRGNYNQLKKLHAEATDRLKALEQRLADREIELAVLRAQARPGNGAAARPAAAAVPAVVPAPAAAPAPAASPVAAPAGRAAAQVRAPRGLARFGDRLVALLRGDARRAAAGARAVTPTPASAPAAPRSLVHRPERAKLPVDIACILDEFSWENLRHEANLYRLPIKGWKDALRATPPAFLLVESAWAGNDGQWQYRITYDTPKPDNPLFELLAYCKDVGIPTVFWNKEDPPNYERFLDVARRFDYVFTTDAACLPRYAADAPGVKAFALPFAAQPTIQNPVNIHRFPKVGDVCFAGAWYPRHPERHEDARLLLEASRHRDLAIYDRYLHHPHHDRYVFPSEFQPFIKGSLGFEAMVEAYRKHRVFLNVNSVKDSPTMFSRRVLEILACGTPVVSTYARGIEELLGADVVPMVRTVDDARREIDRLLDDPHYRDARVLRAQRAIFGAHTYRHRLRQICDAIGVPLPDETPLVTVVTATIRRGFVDNLLQNFHRQTHPAKELIVVINAGADLDEDHVRARAAALGVGGVRVVVAPRTAPLGTCLNLGIEASRGAIFAKMDDDDHYGAAYLEDSLHALEYSGADCVGKETYFTYAEGPDQTLLRTPGKEHVFTKFVIGTTLVARRDLFPRVTFGDTRVGEDTIFLKRLDAARKLLYSHSRFNYVKFYARSLDHHTWKVTEDAYLKNAEFVANGRAIDRVCV